MCFIKNRISVILLLLCFSEISRSQDAVSVKEDVTKIVTAYLSPGIIMTGLSLGRNWQSTAKLKDPLRLDLKVEMVFITIPGQDKIVDLNKLGLKYLKPVTDHSLTPTVVGDIKAINPYIALFSQEKENIFEIANGQTITVHVPSFIIPNSTFKLLPAATISPVKNTIGVPLIQANLGVAYGSEVSLRYGQQFIKGDFNYNVFGLAYKQNLGLLLYGKDEEFSLFDMSMLVGFNNLNFTNKIRSISSDDPILLQDIATQKIIVKTQTMNTELLVSKKIFFFDIFIGPGYVLTTSKFGMLGNYPIVGLTISSQTTKELNSIYTSSIHTDTYVIKDPIAIKFKAQEFYMTTGFQFSYLGILKTSLSYTYGNKYQSLNFGFGFSLDRLMNEYDPRL